MEMIWAERITAAWNKSRDGVIEVGSLLVQAKEQLAHGEFEKMVGSKLPFGERTARRLMAIAKDPRITDRTHVSALPASWGTLYELTKVDDQTFERAVEKGLIRPDMERKDVLPLQPSNRNLARHDEDEEDKRRLAALKSAWRAASYDVREVFKEWVRHGARDEE